MGNELEVHLSGAETSLPTPNVSKTGLPFPGICFLYFVYSSYELRGVFFSSFLFNPSTIFLRKLPLAWLDRNEKIGWLALLLLLGVAFGQ